MRAAAHGDRGQPLKAANTVIDMNDQIPLREACKFGEESIGGFALFRAPDQPVAQHILFSKDRDAGRGKAMIEGEDNGALPMAQCALPAFGRAQPLKPMFFQQLGKATACALE